MIKGFTLIEVLVVAVIIAVLAAVAIPSYSNYIKGSKEKVCKNVAATVADASAVYKSQFPDWTGPTDASGGHVVADIGTLLPPEYNLTVSGSIIIVTHQDGSASGSVNWQ